MSSISPVTKNVAFFKIPSQVSDSVIATIKKVVTVVAHLFKQAYELIAKLLSYLSQTVTKLHSSKIEIAPTAPETNSLKSIAPLSSQINESPIAQEVSAKKTPEAPVVDVVITKVATPTKKDAPVLEAAISQVAAPAIANEPVVEVVITKVATPTKKDAPVLEAAISQVVAPATTNELVVEAVITQAVAPTIANETDAEVVITQAGDEKTQEAQPIVFATNQEESAGQSSDDHSPLVSSATVVKKNNCTQALKSRWSTAGKVTKAAIYSTAGLSAAAFCYLYGTGLLPMLVNETLLNATNVTNLTTLDNRTMSNISMP